MSNYNDNELVLLHLDLIENALQEHDAEGVLYDILKFLLQTFFTVTKEENEAEDDDNESNSGTATPAEPDQDQDVVEQQGHSHVSSNATAAAAWAMLHQGMALEELTIDPFTLSEILRLHILSSGVKIGRSFHCIFPSAIICAFLCL